MSSFITALLVRATTPSQPRAANDPLRVLLAAAAAPTRSDATAIAEASQLAILCPVYGHRGSSGAEPENSERAFRHCVEGGADGVETDLRVAADGAVVLAHDPTTTRLFEPISDTNAETSPFVADRTAAQLALLRTRLGSQPLVTLAGFLDSLAAQPLATTGRPLRICLDIKAPAHGDGYLAANGFPITAVGRREASLRSTDRLFSALATALKDQPTTLRDAIAVGIWHPRQLECARRHLPKDISRWHIGTRSSDSQRFFWTDVDVLSLSFFHLVSMGTTARTRLLQRCNRDGKRVVVWPVRTVIEMMHCWAWGVHGIITDYPVECTELRNAVLEPCPPSTKDISPDSAIDDAMGTVTASSTASSSSSTSSNNGEGMVCVTYRFRHGVELPPIPLLDRVRYWLADAVSNLFIGRQLVALCGPMV